MSITGRAITQGGGVDTSQDTVIAGAMRAGYTAHDANGDPITGSIPDKAGTTITPGNSEQTAVPAGMYTTGAVKVAAIPTNLSATYVKAAGNIAFKTPSANLSVARRNAGGGTAGNYALAIGGYGNSSATRTAIDAYDTNLTRIISAAKTSFMLAIGGSNSAYVIITSSYGTDKFVRAFDAAITESNLTNRSVSSQYSSALSSDDYVLFFGGLDGSSGVGVANVDAYSTSLTKSTPAALSVGRRYAAGASNQRYMICAGGNTSNGSNLVNTVDAYDSSLTRTIATPLSVARWYASGTRVGEFAIVLGGFCYPNPSNTVEAYDSSLTMTVATPIRTARFSSESQCTASANDVAFLIGGNISGAVSGAVDAYDQTLTRTNPDNMAVAACKSAYARTGKYVIAMGGDTTNSNGFTDAVSAWNVGSPYIKLQVNSGENLFHSSGSINGYIQVT